MKPRVTESLLLATVLAAGGTILPAAASEPKQPWAPGIESPGYVWNENKGEKLLALKAEGNAIRGEIAYEVCQNCHGFGAPGDAEGDYPRLAGQHASVLIKQMTDVRAGRRDYPTEYPYGRRYRGRRGFHVPSAHRGSAVGHLRGERGVTLGLG